MFQESIFLYLEARSVLKLTTSRLLPPGLGACFIGDYSLGTCPQGGNWRSQGARASSLELRLWKKLDWDHFVILTAPPRLNEKQGYQESELAQKQFSRYPMGCEKACVWVPLR